MKHDIYSPYILEKAAKNFKKRPIAQFQEPKADLIFYINRILKT